MSLQRAVPGFVKLAKALEKVRLGFVEIGQVFKASVTGFAKLGKLTRSMKISLRAESPEVSTGFRP